MKSQVFNASLKKHNNSWYYNYNKNNSLSFQTSLPHPHLPLHIIEKYPHNRFKTTSKIIQCKGVFSNEAQNPGAPSIWPKIVQNLNDFQVMTITSEQLIAAKNTTPILDIRPTQEYNESHIQDSINIPLYQSIEGWNPYKVVQRSLYALFGIFNGTEMNENFINDVSEVVDKDNGVIIVCNMGGTFDIAHPTIGNPTRSLMAAHELCRKGFKNVKVLRDGINGWINEERDLYTLMYDSDENNALETE